VSKVISSERRNFEEQLLVGELTHRMNNEFAAAIAVVSLAAGRSPNGEVKSALAAVEARLHSYAQEATSGNPLHFLTRITARIRVIDSCFADGGELIRVYLMAIGRKGLPLAAVRSEAIGPSRLLQCRPNSVANGA